MDAPLAAVMVTDWPDGTAPLTGEITGAASCGKLMVYAAEATALLL
jgi:hypothetical protein